jgi:hypothetical protein
MKELKEYESTKNTVIHSLTITNYKNKLQKIHDMKQQTIPRYHIQGRQESDVMATLRTVYENTNNNTQRHMGDVITRNIKSR